MLHQLEFAAKKTKQHIGLGYLAHMVPLCLHGGDPLSFFKVDEYSKRVRQEFDKGGLFEGLIQKYLLDNSHHLRLFLTPNEKLAEKQEREDAAKLAELTRALSEAEKEAIVS